MDASIVIVKGVLRVACNFESIDLVVGDLVEEGRHDKDDGGDGCRANPICKTGCKVCFSTPLLIVSSLMRNTVLFVYVLNPNNLTSGPFSDFRMALLIIIFARA